MRAQGDLSTGGKHHNFNGSTGDRHFIRRHSVTENGDIGAVDRNGNL